MTIRCSWLLALLLHLTELYFSLLAHFDKINGVNDCPFGASNVSSTVVCQTELGGPEDDPALHIFLISICGAKERTKTVKMKN